MTYQSPDPQPYPAQPSPGQPSGHLAPGAPSGHLPPGAPYGHPAPAVPGTPRPRKNRTALVAIVGTLVILLFCLIGGAAAVFMVNRTAEDSTDQQTSPRTPRQPSYTPESDALDGLDESTLRPVDPGHGPLALGQTLLLRNRAGDEVRLTIDNARFQRKACESFMKVPKGKGLLVADVTVKVVTGSVRVTDFDFNLRSPGNRAISGGGGMLAGCEPQLPQGKIKAGQRRSGKVAFVVAAAHGEIVFMPVGTDQPIGTWKLG